MVSHDERIANITFASVMPHYITKVEKKEEQKRNSFRSYIGLPVLMKNLEELIASKVTFDIFFDRAILHPNAHLITGLICGYRIEEIENPLTKKIRYLDKLVDELAKGKTMDKILRK